MQKENIRLTILKKLEEESGKAPTEFIANEFLHQLHDDIGTIKRTLIDLVENGLILWSNNDKQSSIDTITKVLNTTCYGNSQKDKENSKNTLRFIDSLGNQEKIKTIRLHITIKGLKFLYDYEQRKVNNEIKELSNDLVKLQTKLTKYQIERKDWPYYFSFTSVLVSFLALIVSIFK